MMNEQTLIVKTRLRPYTLPTLNIWGFQTAFLADDDTVCYTILSMREPKSEMKSDWYVVTFDDTSP